MNEESFFTKTEEELFQKIKRVYNSINKNLQEAGFNDDSISSVTMDETISLSDDGLSNVSDISSIASFNFSNAKKTKKEFRTPQIDKHKHRKSKIPVFDLKRKNRQNAAPDFNNKISRNNQSNQGNTRYSNVAQNNQKNAKNKIKIQSKQIDRDIVESNEQNQVNHASPNHLKINNNVNIYNYQEPLKPKNFLIPELSIYTRVCVCIFEGRDFPSAAIGRGERSTYAVIQLHPDILPIQSPISFNKTKRAIYNGGFDISCSGLDFTSVTPMVSVYDYISENKRELIGVAFIELHLAKKFNNEMCIFMLDEWLDIYAVNNRVKTGKVKITLIFHTDEKNVSNIIKKKKVEPLDLKKKPNKNTPLLSSESEEEDKPVINDEIEVINNDSDIDFIADDDEFIKKENEKLKNEEKMKRNKNKVKKETKFESLGIQAEPEYQKELTFNFHSLSSISDQTNKSNSKTPFNFNINNSNIGNNSNNNDINIKSNIHYNKKTSTNTKCNKQYIKHADIQKYNNDANIYNDPRSRKNHVINETEAKDEDVNYDDNFNFTFDQPLDMNENDFETVKKNSNHFINDENIIESDSSIPQKAGFNNDDDRNAKFLDEKHLNFIDESMVETMGSVLSIEDNNEKTLTLGETHNEIINNDQDNQNIKNSKRYTSYSDFHFMDEIK